MTGSYNLYRLYGGEYLPSDQIDPSQDYIPIRDASIDGDAKHKKTTVRDLKNAIGSVVSTNRNPTTGDIPPGGTVLWNNTLSNETYSYANFSGTLWRSEGWSIWTPSGIYTFDSTTIFFDNTNLTWDSL